MESHDDTLLLARASEIPLSASNGHSTGVEPPVGAAHTHALLLIPAARGKRSIEWRAAARFIVRWQVECLRRAGAQVTLLADEPDGVDVWASLIADAGAPSAPVVPALAQFNLHEYAQLAGPEATILLMAAPCLTTDFLDAALEAHRRSRRDSTLLRSAGRHGKPYLWIFNVRYACATWDAIQSAGSLDLARLATIARARPRAGGRAQILHSGGAEELAALERLWARRVPFDFHGHAPTICALGENGSHAASARLTGPVLLEDGVVIGAGAHVGPWVVLGESAVIGEGAWVEHAAIGARAEVEPEACVYRSVIEPGARVVNSMPVLKARLGAGDAAPTLQHSVVTERRLSDTYVVMKRLMDISVGVVALVALAPILLLVLLLCMLLQGWPIFFFHERLGQRGVLFHTYKLRTMQRRAHLRVDVLDTLHTSARFKLQGDPRVTRLGRVLRKASLDELPQIINVLHGDMSIVGPRPIVSSESVRYGPYVEDLLRTLPGVTGLWQINGRSATTYQRRVMLDVQYGDTCSLRQDIRILLHSVPAVLLLRGAE